MELDLHVTNKCNLYCKHCIYESNELTMPDLTSETVQRLIPDFKQIGIKEVHLTGGEPMLNPYFFEIVEILKKNNFGVRLQSNGMLINVETVNKLKQSGISSILISIDGLEGNHNFLRNNINSFSSAMHAAELCVKMGIYTRVNTVLHKKNLEDIESLLKATMALGVDQHSFFYLTPGGRGRKIKNLMLTLQEWENAQKSIEYTAEKLKCTNKVKFQNLIVNLKNDKNDCRVCKKDNYLILSDGSVYPCVFFIHSEYEVGNIDNERLVDIWSDGLRWMKYEIERNKRCERSSCGGGCKGLSYLLTGDIKNCDPRCECEQHNNLIPGCIRRYENLSEH